MEQLAKDFGDQAHFLFVYVREAHPGEHYPPHQYFEQKVLHAKAIREFGVRRDILIDSLYGGVHRWYGGVSNMSWIIDHTGLVAYRASWTVASDIRAALSEILQTRDLRRGGKQVASFYRELMGLRPAVGEGPNEQRFMGGAVAQTQFEAAAARRRQLQRPGETGEKRPNEAGQHSL